MGSMGEDARRGTRRRLTVQESADALGVTVDAVRRRVKRGTIDHEREGGRVYVLLGADEYSPGHAQVTTRAATRAPGKPRTAPPNSSPRCASSCRLSARPTPRRGGYWPPSSGSRP